MRRDSRIARDLSAALFALGYSTSPRQLERLGEFGVLGPTPEEVNPALIARAQEALELTRRYTNGDLAALVMFGRGYDFDKPQLARAYLKAYERIETFIQQTAGSLRGYDAAERVAMRLANRAAKSTDERPLRDRLKKMRTGRNFISVKQSLTSFYTDAVMILVEGRATSDQGLKELFQATGVDAITREALPGKAPPVLVLPYEWIKPLLKQLRLGGLAATVMRSSYHQLQVARDDTNSLISFAKVFTPLARRSFGLRQAFGFAGLAELPELATALMIPGMVLVRAVDGDELDRINQTIEINTPRFLAMNELLDVIPERFYPLVETFDRREELSNADRAQLVALIDQFELTHPGKYELITSDVPALPR